MVEGFEIAWADRAKRPEHELFIVVLKLLGSAVGERYREQLQLLFVVRSPELLLGQREQCLKFFGPVENCIRDAIPHLLYSFSHLDEEIQRAPFYIRAGSSIEKTLDS